MNWADIDQDAFFVGQQFEVSRVASDYFNQHRDTTKKGVSVVRFPFEEIRDDTLLPDEVVMVYGKWPDTKAEVINTRTWERRLDTEFLKLYPEGRICKKCGNASIEAGSPRDWCKACVEEDREQRLLDASAMFYQLSAEHQAEALPEGEEKQKMLAAAKLFKSLRPSVQAQERLELEQLKRQWEAEDKAREAEERFITKELNRMNSLPEPIFILDLPDEMIQKLIAADFTTVGQVLFGVQVASERVVGHAQDDDFVPALVHSRDSLIHAVGQEGYNLIGSRLIQHGYLQRNYFISEFNREPVYKPAKGKTSR